MVILDLFTWITSFLYSKENNTCLHTSTFGLEGGQQAFPCTDRFTGFVFIIKNANAARDRNIATAPPAKAARTAPLSSAPCIETSPPAELLQVAALSRRGEPPQRGQRDRRPPKGITQPEQAASSMSRELASCCPSPSFLTRRRKTRSLKPKTEKAAAFVVV